MKTRSPFGFLAVWTAFLAAGRWLLPFGFFSLPVQAVPAIVEAPPVDSVQQFRDDYAAVFGTAPGTSGVALSVAGAFNGTGSCLLQLQGRLVEIVPRISMEITRFPEVLSRAMPGERVYSVYADVCTADSIVLSIFLVRSFEDHTEYWFAGVASPEFVDAIAPVQESEFRAALLPIAHSLQLNLEGLEVDLPPSGSYDGPQQSSDCARLARRIGICRDSFKARARLAQSGLIEQLELLGEQHEARIAACESAYCEAVQQCGQGRDAAVHQAEVGFAIAKSAAECARRLGYDAAKSALNTGLALAAAAEVTCIAGAHAALYICLASLGWTGAGIPGCIAGYLAAQVICHAGLVAAVVII